LRHIKTQWRFLASQTVLGGFGRVRFEKSETLIRNKLVSVI